MQMLKLHQFEYIKIKLNFVERFLKIIIKSFVILVHKSTTEENNRMCIYYFFMNYSELLFLYPYFLWFHFKTHIEIIISLGYINFVHISFHVHQNEIAINF